MNRKDQARLNEINNRNNGAITLVKEKPQIRMSKEGRCDLAIRLNEILESIPEGYFLDLTPPPHRIDISFKEEQ